MDSRIGFFQFIVVVRIINDLCAVRYGVQVTHIFPAKVIPGHHSCCLEGEAALVIRGQKMKCLYVAAQVSENSQPVIFSRAFSVANHDRAPAIGPGQLDS